MTYQTYNEKERLFYYTRVVLLFVTLAFLLDNSNIENKH